MSSQNLNGSAVRCCLIALRNKKFNGFESVNNILDAMAGYGYYFDKVSFVNFSDSGEISRAVKDGKNHYENVIVYCPKSMENTLKNYIGKIYGAQFDELGILNSDNSNVFIFYSDGGNRLRLKDVKKILDKKYGVKFDKLYIKTVGAPSEKINQAIEKAKGICPDLEFNVDGKYGECSIEIVYSAKTPKMLLDEVTREVTSILNEYIYAMENLTLAERLFQVLKLRGLKISVAESFTGGGIGKRLVDIPGISEVYFEGLNTYSNEAKIARLGVKELTLKQYGAVSEQTAYEMAEGLLR
ncbi:MAG: nicotinamide-nucleotide amidohydrolase family protein, partial [Clostridia bacterium]|nr:nicotinamide-nucleotide amidohydrolase family protein [Clostridia bacterium]